jgi:hypothetical protein
MMVFNDGLPVVVLRNGVPGGALKATSLHEIPAFTRSLVVGVRV